MELAKLRSKLLVAGRVQAPADTVPYAFEQRIMARLRSTHPLSAWSLWGKALWWAAVACVAITFLSSAWTLWQDAGQTSEDDFSQDFESAVFVMADSAEESW